MSTIEGEDEGLRKAFFRDDDFLTTEYKLLETSTRGVQKLRAKQAKRHLREGFDVRLLMMQTSRVFMRDNSVSSSPLAPSVWEHFCVHLNAYYVNLRGALDNLAWMLNHEFDLLPSVSEEVGADRSSCNLFGSKFLAQLRATHPSLCDKLRSRDAWKDNFRELRDPAAHRIPLTPLGGVLNSEDLEELRRLEAKAAAPREQLKGKSRSELLRQAQLLAKYVPSFAVSGSRGLTIKDIPAQLAADHMQFLQTALDVFEELWPPEPHAG